MKLDVYSNDTRIGTLEQLDVTSYVFTYEQGVDDDRAVSLLMRPSVKREWEHRSLHPVFQVSLPEGSLRQIITRSFAKQFDHFGETELLGVIGSHLVGRIKVCPSGSTPSKESPSQDFQELLRETDEEMLEHYLQVHAEFSGVSGGFGKYLAKSPTAAQSGGHSTLAFDHWIVKTNDADHPGLVFNEYHSMMVAKHMGLPVPEFHASKDFSRLVIGRFDIAADGKHLGFEDMAALNALGANEKFEGSVERVIKSINAFCQPAAAKASREQFFAQYLACMTLRNGDAHLKNFGLLYSGMKDVRLSPCYDLVTMSAYAPRRQNGDALDEPAMSLNGVRRWLDQKSLSYLAGRCAITETQRAMYITALCAAVKTVAAQMVKDVDADTAHRPMAKRMLELWSHGLELFDGDVATEVAAMATSIEGAAHQHMKPTGARLRLRDTIE